MKGKSVYYLYFICLMVSVGGIVFDIAIISGTVSFVQWVFNFLIVFLFPYFFNLVGGAATFVFLSGMSLLQWMFTFLYVPETRGKTLGDIENL